MNEFTLSIVLILLAGIFQGTYGLGMRKFAPLSWEAFWGTFSVVGMICIPVIWAAIVVPDMWGIIEAVPRSQIILVMAFGAGWGVGAFLFGLAVNYLGMSISYGTAMGLGAAMGSLVPLLQIGNVGSNRILLFIILGLVVMVLGVIVLTYAGILRDKAQSGGKEIAGIERGKRFYIGLLFAILSGISAAILNIGFTYASTIADVAVKRGTPARNASLIAWVVILAGGFVANFVYVLVLLIKNKTYRSLGGKGTARGYWWALVTAVLWFAALGLYGQGAALMGKLGNVVGWTMLLALALVISNLWGIRGGEWKGVPRAFRVMLVGNVLLVISWTILGYCNHLISG